MGLEWVLFIGLAAAGLGGLVGYKFNAANKADRERIAELTEQVAGKEEELREYRTEVVNQFAATAEKFKSLDESYHALHRQLATSAVALCGDQATPLLPQAEQTLLGSDVEAEAADEEKEVAAVSESEVAAADADPSAESEPVAEDGPVSEDEPVVVAEADTEPAVDVADALADSEQTAEAEDVPTLTETDEPAVAAGSEEQEKNEIKDELAEKRAS